MSRRAGLLLACCIALPQCSQREAPEQAGVSIGSPVGTPIDATEIGLSKHDLANVCRAALAALNRHDLAIMNVSSNTGDLVQVRYARPSDGKLWINECRIEGDRVIWRTVDAFGAGSGTGRWRSLTAVDEVITYKLDGPRVSITTSSPDGSISTETYATGGRSS